MNKITQITLLLWFSVSWFSYGQELRFPGFFGDHMVLQRQAPIPIWGWAAANQTVTVTLGDSTVSTQADDTGSWRVEIPAREADASGLKLSASTQGQTKVINDVMIGEVWLCSGQSNMEWSVRQSANPNEEIAAANHPLIRQMKIAHILSSTPKNDVASQWHICSPKTAANFTAAGYYMARELHEQLQVPIGLLNISWGGTRIDPWIPIEGYSAVAELASTHQKLQLNLPGSVSYKSALKTHLNSVDQWLAKARSDIANNQAVVPTPAFPNALKPPKIGASSPTAIYNAMLNPVVGYGMRGAVWYQGESNHTEGKLYYDKKKALLAGWRKLWGIGDFPFYYVQIAPFEYGKEAPHVLAEFWETQAACLDLPKTGMVVTADIGDIKDIHPKNKQEVGRRLSRLALKHTYGKNDLIASGPRFDSIHAEHGKLYVKFTNVGDGLESRDAKALSHFEIIGEKPGFLTATAEIQAPDTIVLSHPELRQPAAMRFAWHKLAEPNLCNSAGLPAYTFRAGKVPVLDCLKLNAPEAADFQLVYDLNLKSLGEKINYTTDNSSQIGSDLERVGYFIELVQSDGTLQWTWVTMDPFTDDPKKIGVPFYGAGIHFQKSINNLKVISSQPKDTTNQVTTGNIEFWPSNYSSNNSGKVTGASDSRWDIGDRPDGQALGYGSMQIHNTTAKKTVFAINHWKAGARADVGIGNSSGDTDDWTFSSNAGGLQSARLRILVKRKKK